MDIIQLLRDEHQQVLDLFERFEALAEESARRPVAEELLQLLMVHEKAEEDAVFEKVRSSLPDSRALDEALIEQAALKDRIREIVSDPRSEALAGRIFQLRELVMDHIATEQNRIFPAILRDVPEPTREKLASDFKSAKAGHMVEFPSLTITMAPEAPSEKPQRR